MKRFPDVYSKPELISLDEGLHRGWTSACADGANAASGCNTGFDETGLGPPGGDGFVNPDILNQGS